MAPDEAALDRDLCAAAYRLGERSGRWRLARLLFPHAHFEITAAPRADSPDHFLLRLDVQGYPGLGPTGDLWHSGRDTALTIAERPRGPNGVLLAFQVWGVPCIYHPIDRLAESHWPNDFHELRWGRGSDITTYLETIHGLLNHPEYLGATFPQTAPAV